MTSPEGEPAAEPSLGAEVRRAFGWSVANQIALRFASFGSGVVLARVLTPEDFGVYGVALAAVTILVSLNDLGVILGLVRWKGDLEQVAPTCFTLAMASSTALWIGALVAAGPLAALMGDSSAEGVVRLLSVTVLIDGITAVPLGVNVRELRQHVVARAELAAIPVGIIVSLLLAFADTGPWALAIGRVVGAIVTCVLFVMSSPVALRFGWDAAVARHLMAFGLPVAGTTLVEELLLNLDYFIVGAVLGVEALGFYLLAFNLANWPISIMKEGIRRVSIAGFSKIRDERERLHEQFLRATSILVSVTLPMCIVLSMLARPLIEVIYGEKWATSATALGVLAFLGLARLTLGFFFDLLIALGRSVTTFVLQAIWLVTLAPALYFATTWTETIRGPAVAHLIVAFDIVTPGYLVVLHVNGVRFTHVARRLVAPIGAGALLVLLLAIDRSVIDGSFAQLAAGAFAVLVYAVVLLPFTEARNWLLRRRARQAA